MKPLSLLFAAAIVVAGCSSNADKGKNDSASGAAPAAATAAGGAGLTGAGATFPYPIYSKWFTDYAAKSGVKINYQPIGSGGGIRQLQEQTVDFGASDAPMSDDEMSKAKGGPVQHIPTVLGAVCITYNVPEITQPLKLTGDLVADIFLGKVTKWNDSRIAALNKGVTLPSRDLVVVHRSDGSGTSYIFRLSERGESGVEDFAGEGKGRQLANGPWRQGQRWRDGPGEADAGCDRLCRAGVCAPEQAAGGIDSKCRRPVRGAVHRRGDGSGRRRGREASAELGLSCLDRECARRTGVSDLLLHVDSAVQNTA